MADIIVTNPGSGNDIKANLDTAHTAASDGDVLVMPDNMVVLSSTCTFTKKVSMRGAGSSSEIQWDTGLTDNQITNTYVDMLRWNINDNKPSGIVISNMKFTSRDVATSSARDTAIRITNAIDFRITGCTISYFGYAAVNIRHRDNLARGVIDSNTFTINAKGTGYGLGYGVLVTGEDQRWIADPEWGTNNFIFIENNTFTQHRHSVASGGCGKFVYRYNTDVNNGVQKNTDNVVHAVDSHAARATGLGTFNNFATRAFECYNNTMSHTLYFDGTTIPGSGVSTSSLVQYTVFYRGGAALVHDNSFLGTAYGAGMYIDSLPFSITKPIPYAPSWLPTLKYGNSKTGTSQAESNDDVWYWNNTVSSYGTQFVNIHTSYFSNNNQYHASQPSWYTPYTYPHPLRSI